MRAGTIEHLCFFHDPDCEFYATEDMADCKCNPIVKRYAEPVRS
jgi:hypothetical protein